LRWSDIIDMPQGELVEHVDQLRDWAALFGGYERLKE
jgi:hypothetical protein